VKRRVQILTTEPPERSGGQEHFVRALAAILEGRGYEVEIFHRENSVPGWLRGPAFWPVKHLLPALQGISIGRTAARREDDAVAAVISNSVVGWYPFRPRRRGIRRLHYTHGTYRGQAEAIRPFISAPGYWKLKWWDSMVLERLSCRGKLCLTNAEHTRQELRRFFGVEATTLWYPLDTGHFRPMDRVEARRLAGCPGEGPVGLFVGSAQPTKGFPMVRWLIERFPQVHWVLALRGAVPEEVAARPGVRLIRNAGFAELPALYNAADFSVCPSRYEAFGYVVVEALACGTPVVASPGGASREFLSRPPFDCFLIADPEDREGFARAVEKILSDPARCRRDVLEEIRPELLEKLSPAKWEKRFFEVTGL
jgi:glycosyltransferase involved in cell wall biosynthesis